tara:strand:- start:533 stop:919 length:387 start_codon:yes stop_codon:yes gene_type:complete
MKYFSLIILVLFCFTSCDSITNPTFEGVENVVLEEMSTKNLVVKAEMIINNPNPFALDLEEADMYAIVEGIELARINQTFGTEMPANQNFRMPVSIDMDLTKLYADDPLGAISKGLKIMNEKRLDVLF